MSKERPKNIFERAVHGLEQRTGRSLAEHLASELPAAMQRKAAWDQEGIKDVISLDPKSFEILTTTGKLREEGRGLTGHPQLGQTEIGDTVSIIGSDDQGRIVYRKAKVVRLVRPDEESYRVNWEIELIAE